MKKIYILAFGLVLFYACSNSDNDNANVNLDVKFGAKVNILKYSEMIDTIQYVELDSCNSVRRIDEIKLCGDVLYLCDKHESSISMYKKDGTFVRKLNRKGRAKNEYCSITDFDISLKNGSIHIWDDISRRFVIYSDMGDYIRSFKNDDVCRDFAVLKNGDYLLYKPDYCEELHRGLWLIDSVGHFQKQLVEIDDDFRYCPILPIYMSRYGDDVIGIMGAEDHDNIYAFGNNKLDMNFHINYGMEIPSALKSSTQSDISKYIGETYCKVQYFENKRWLYLMSTDYKNTELSVYDKQHAKYYQSRQQEVVNDVNLYAQIMFMDDDYLIGFVETQFIKDIPYLNQLFPHTSDEASPIIMIAKLK